MHFCLKKGHSHVELFAFMSVISYANVHIVFVEDE